MNAGSNLPKGLHMAKPKLAIDNTKENTKAQLIADAKQAAELARFALILDTMEARRDAHMLYGRALLPLRAINPSNTAFNDDLKKHGILVSDATYRSNCMWLAEIVANP